ncbi:hypothetical protein Ga0123461_0946 [Mariprofundus aestuarium]|uniref:Glycosyl transferase n=1 Tax=Mariprofundus aestuarium TaxID=1921086 RepID=A0A2K8L561_MARES|nr:hypothetical protein [Mariprofundus aestuarium]ATX79366.1 hypothetical protein Ga0123461_0946 [Mariprofundus aestuarium]
MNIAVYISGHGFGHLAQTAPVLNRLYQSRPSCRFLIRCSLPEPELLARLDFNFELESEPVDLGVIQKSAIEEDREGSIAQMRAWTVGLDTRIDREVSLLNAFKPDLVLSDISPLAFPAARALAVPGIGLATLDWHTIYSHWLDANDPIIQALKRAYEVCDLLLSPPMAMDMQVFPNRQSIPLIAAYPGRVNFVARQGRKKCALVIFGGSNQPPYDLNALGEMSDWLFLIPGAPEHAPDNVHSISFSNSLKAVDLMPHVDAVVCKPGYGILAECWRTSRPMVWVERPDFPEYPMLKKWLDEVFPSQGMNRSDFQSGNWLAMLEGAVASTREFPDLGRDGAEVASEIIISMLEG